MPKRSSKKKTAQKDPQQLARSVLDAIAPDADLRTDLPRYRVYRHGELVEEPDNLLAHWRDDFVGFLTGCSFTFEQALAQAGPIGLSRPFV